MLLYGTSALDGPAMLLLLLGGLALDGWLGDMPALFRIFPHPVVVIGRLVAALDRRLNRENRGERALLERGVVTVVAILAVAVLAGIAVAWFCRVVKFGWVVEIFVIAVMISQRSLFDHVKAVMDALESGGLGAGREAVRHIVGRDPASLDAHGVARAAIESLAENFSDGVIAPALWYALLGLPGLFAYKAANTLDSMIGHRSPRYLKFGWAAARFDDLVNLVPARLSGLVVAVAALGAQGNAAAACRIMWRDARKHRSPNAGWPEAAMAGALDLALAGPRRYGGEVVIDAWMGSGRARAVPNDIRRALAVFVTACLVHAGLYGALYLAVLRAPLGWRLL
jgi:adenosylcobinamide-phosphate synthase